MKALSVISALLFLVLLLNCKGRQKGDIDSWTFRIFQPKYDLTSDELLKNGFTRDDSHVTSIFKKINDSTELRFFLNDSTQRIVGEYWTIICPSNTTFNDIEEFVVLNWGRVTSSYCPKEDTVLFFYVGSMFGDLDFRCVYAPEDSFKILRVEHNHPHYYDFYKPFDYQLNR